MATWSSWGRRAETDERLDRLSEVNLVTAELTSELTCRTYRDGDDAQAIAGLTPDALDWKPTPDTPSLAVLVTHTCGAERYWVGDVAGRDDSGRLK